jgi:hypothetical protein
MMIPSRSDYHDGQLLHVSSSNSSSIPSRVTASSSTYSSSVYTSQHWQDVAEYANGLNLTIIPEVAIPTNAASWAGISNLVMDCPKYICTGGSNVPLNIRHPQMPLIIRTIFKQVTTLFGRPSFIHLGGNDISVATRCWNEAIHREGSSKKKINNSTNNSHHSPWMGRRGVAPPLYHYEDELEAMLSTILFGTKDDTDNHDGLGYQPQQIIRPPPPIVDRSGGYGNSIEEWADDGPTEQQDVPTTTTNVGVGSVYQYKKHQLALNGTNEYILQPIELNMATTVRGQTTGWEIYQQTVEIIRLHQNRSNFRGMIVSTEALDPSMIDQRNVMGKLLAIAMAVYQDSDDRINNIYNKNINNRIAYYPQYTSQVDFDEAYLKRCRQLFEDDTTTSTRMTRPSFCHLLGRTDQRIHGSEQTYQNQYRTMWKAWTETICRRLTVIRPDQLELTKVPKQVAFSIQDAAFTKYWEDLNKEQERKDGYLQSLLEIPSSTRNDSIYSNIPYQDRMDQRDIVSESTAPVEGRERMDDEPPSVLYPLFGMSTSPIRGVIVDLTDTLVPTNELHTFMKDVMAPLGLNALQLSLITKLGCVIELKSLSQLFHIAPRPSHADPPTDETLQEIVRIGSTVGIDIIPEISITTQATGWYHADFLVPCPNTLCNTGEIVNDVTRGTLLPVVIAVVSELHRIFNNTSFIHLGSDERNASEDCWKESGQIPSYDTFEEILTRLLDEKGWYNDTNIVRWENQERVIYPSRTGRVTQYQYSVPNIGNPQYDATTDPMVFGSILSTSDVEPWNIYTQTRQWMKVRPKGIFLKVSPADLQGSKQHLVAFAIGLSSDQRPLNDATELDAFLDQVCQAHPSLCPAPAKLTRGVPSLRGMYICKSMTRSTSDPVMRTNGALSTLALTVELDEKKN